MPVYAITGKLGSGKGKAAIDRLRKYLHEGKRVATNCDVFLEHLMPPTDKHPVIRVPDKPVASDLYMIGSGNKFVEFEPILTSTADGFKYVAPSPKILKGFDEAHNGALILDECGSWLNTRNFQDKGRAEMLEWAIHGRKYGWDIYFVMQNISQVDKQLRDSLLEYVVRLNRLDRMKIPVVSNVVKAVTAGAVEGNMPRIHIGVVRLGSSPDGLVADRWIFRGDDLNNAYSTTQVFSESYPHSTHSLLSAWHLSAKYDDATGKVTPRHLPPKPMSPHMSKFLAMSLLLGGLLGAFGTHLYHLQVPPAHLAALSDVPVYSLTLKGVGTFRVDGSVHVVLSDGRTVLPARFKEVPGGWEALIENNVWVRGQ